MKPLKTLGIGIALLIGLSAPAFSQPTDAGEVLDSSRMDPGRVQAGPAGDVLAEPADNPVEIQEPMVREEGIPATSAITKLGERDEPGSLEGEGRETEAVVTPKSE